MSKRPSSVVRRWGAIVASAAVVATSLVTVGAAATPAEAAPFACDANTIYTQNASGEIRSVDVSPNGSGLGDVHASGQRANALGISADGNMAYTLDNSNGSGGANKQIAIYNGATEQTETKALGDPSVPGVLIRGAVSPETGIYYYSGSSANSYLGAYDPATGSAIGQVGVLATGIDGNGDFAFGANGELYVLADRDIFVVQPNNVPTTPGSGDIPLTHVTRLPAGTQGNGIAFGANGKLFVSQSGSISEVDLATGQMLRTIATRGFSNTDMSSCSFPNTISLQKDIVDRFESGDQFTLDIDGDTIDDDRSATTTGAMTGLQPVIAGPVFVEAGETYTVSETAAGGADLADYDSSISCVDSGGAPVATTGSGPSWDVVFPTSDRGENVICTITNDAHEAAVPGLDLRKTSDPANGSSVEAGDTITYTVEAENTGNTALDPVEIADDLSQVFDSATYRGDVTTAIDGTEETANPATITGDDLAWTGALQPGQTVTITYSVSVNEGVAGASIENRVTASGTPPGPGEPVVPPAVTTEHPVAGFEIAKSADPASGTVLEPGDTVTYTVTGTNTGATLLDPASIVDDLSGVLAHAAYNGDATATSGEVSVSGSALSWTGALAAGETVEITYSATVAKDASSVAINNSASGSATPQTPDPNNPGGPTIPGAPIVPAPVETSHPVLASGFAVAKSADPASGTAVDPGDTVTYTVTGENTGDTLLDPATITDSLAAVLDVADYNGDASATSGTVSVDGDELTWSGSLPAGERVEITYSVTVKGDAGGALLSNTASGEGTPRIPEDPSDPESPTTPGETIAPPPAETEHPVNAPGFELSKSVDPVSGTAVDTGAVLTYTLVGANTGETALDPVTIVDDLSDVLAHAAYNGDVSASVNGEPAASPEVSGTQLSWSGALDAGETVTITYSVTVGSDAAGESILNAATAEATPPGGETIVPPPVETDNPVNVPGFSVSKSADPETGSAVDPGDVVTYTVTGVNTGETVLDPVSIVDDLSGVLAHAAYNGDASASTGAVALDDEELVWSGSLGVGERVIITYSVTVHGDAGGETLRNEAAGSATPPGDAPPIETPPSTTEHPVNEPGFEILKTAAPGAGTAVDPGGVVSYTLTGVNTGETVLDPVSIVDDLSGVLAHAAYNGDVAASSGAVAVEGEKLSWTGGLGIGERVIITYSVTVNGDAGGATLVNTAGGSATPPGGSTLTPPPVETEHPVNEPGFEFTKTADPSSGTSVAAGGIVTYTLTGVNTGATDLERVEIVDDLSRVLQHAAYRGDAVAHIGDREADAPSVEGSRLSWSGPLASGETVTVTYSVRVNDDAAGQTMVNRASASATPPGGVTITPPETSTEHPVKTQLAVTGERAVPWLAGLGALLLAGGGVLLVTRRRDSAL
ncbi:isopeptide-forming domain-containing fimbrial protein [Leucobacter sp. CSA1]|uniref:Isopeptide-forming domain-containing fimbrial protein n=1 Tax=Leucobacter chromiisoli TaxID=2796471 RepID=A0A934QB76_9MICO|nr:isopeptide-forming domain-containing fimbrial protein [Leucobacter chromiisoli]MBK0420102.1 isopeptide-forming domain-containing fimbrial protein [Leucobacter chromiisoli]